MSQLDPEIVETLLSKRANFIQALISTPRKKRELTELLDCSRSTIDRVLRSLADQQLVEYRDGSWRATAVGVCAYRQRGLYTDFIEDLSRVAPILSELPPENSVDEQFLRESNSYLSTEAVPDAVLVPVLASVHKADSVCGVVPKALAGSAADFYDFATSGTSYKLELVMTETVFDQLYEVYPEATNEAIRDPNVTLLRGDIEVEYGLWISDNNEAGIIVYSKRGIQGTILNDTQVAIEWATEQYESVKRKAGQVYTREEFH
jgi:predicted transcriptional regulator